KLLAYKDEYEVARLYSDTDFLKDVIGRFEGDVRVKFHLAPPLFAKRDPATGKLRKREFGGYMILGFRLLARLRFLRGTLFDPFGRLADRKLERQLITAYEDLVGKLLDGLRPETVDVAVKLLSLPEKMRGY